MSEAQPASAHTTAANRAVAQRLPFHERADFERASRGLLAQLDPPVIEGSGGRPLWDLRNYAFLAGEAPPEVNPSLWRQAQLNLHHGLFEVVEGIYQVRGYDLANVTFVRGHTGWIVIDPLTVAETAAAAKRLVDEHFGPLPVSAVIYTHSHVDHFGGVRGIISDDDVAQGVRIIAPEGFLEAAVSENVAAGPAMRRRAMYMYGLLLPVGPRGHVDCGLGKATPFGSTGLIAPTESVTHTGQLLTVDGVDIEFQLTPGTEAPAEMNFWFPAHRALCMAENCTATLHNLYTLRGAEIRDAREWSRYLDEALALFAHRSDVAFASHHWPRWGRADIEAWLCGQRDAYRYLHDETLRLANHGLTPAEIAEQVQPPPALAGEWFNRDYYGTVSHNVKAVYQRYLGWYDANPANLHPLPPAPAATKLVQYMGGADAVLARARADFDAGEYRWVAQVVNAVVFADPSNRAARELQADALEQLGYQAESGPWRDVYLMGAQELRSGTPSLPGTRPAAADHVLQAMTAHMVLDLCAVLLDGPAAHDVDVAFDLVLDDDPPRRVTVRHGVLHHGPAAPEGAAVTLRTSTHTFARIANRLDTLDDAITSGGATVEGDAGVLRSFFGLLDGFELFFPIIEP